MMDLCAFPPSSEPAALNCMYWGANQNLILVKKEKKEGSAINLKNIYIVKNPLTFFLKVNFPLIRSTWFKATYLHLNKF